MTISIYEPNIMCPMRGVDAVIGKLNNCIPIYVCAKTCNYSLKYHRLESISDEDVMSLILTDNEIILGDVTDKIRKMVISILSERDPEMIAIVSTCLPEVIGIPFEAFADKLSRHTGKKVICAQTECIRYPNYRDGMDVTLAALCGQLGGHNGEPHSANGNSINLIGGLRISELEEIKSILKPYNISINSEIPTGSIKKYENIHHAQASIPLSYNYEHTVNTIKKKFSVKAITSHPPIGISASSHFYTDIVSTFTDHISELTSQLEKRERDVREQVKASLNKLEGRSVAVFGCTMDELPLAVALEELGMEIVHVSTPTIKSIDQEYLRRLSFPVSFQSNISEELDIIRKKRPDTIIGSFPHIDLARELGIPSTQNFWALQRKYGYDGIAYIAKFLCHIINNSVYQQHKELKGKWMISNSK